MKQTMTKAQHRRVAAVRVLLHEAFPNCFADFGEPKRPLAIGIGVRIALTIPEIGGTLLSLALNDYTGGPTYLSAITEGATRINLDGSPDSDVTAAQADLAKRRLDAVLEFRRLAKTKNPSPEMQEDAA